MAVATAANWGRAWLVSQFFLTITDAIGQAGTFWLFAAFSVLAFVWITKRVPETKGHTLEEIEPFWEPSGQTPGTDDARSRAPISG